MAIENKSRRATNPTSAASAAAAAAAALSAMLAHNACPTQAFQPAFLAPTPRTMYHAAALSSPVVPATTMRIFSSPWEPECGGMQQQQLHQGGIQRRRRFGPMIFAPPIVFQGGSQLEIRDPAVAETGDSYRLTFDLPAEAGEQDGVDVSVSDRLLTVKARVTQEDLGGHSTRRRGGGWATRSSRTDSVSRSFVLPEGVSADGVEASWVSDRKMEVKFSKDPTKARATDGAAAAATHDSQAGAASPSTVSQAESSTGSTVYTGEDKVPLSSTSAEYLSSLSRARAAAGAAGAENANVGASAAGLTAESSSPPPADSASRESQGSSRYPQSVFEALDSELGEFAKAMWGEDVLKFPTQEEMAERAEAAREERATRVLAIRRATMATNVSEMEDGSYLVKVALPEGTTRDEVTLTATPGNALRVTFAAKGRRSLYKDVRLPKDALFSEISAKFEAEGKHGEGGDEASSSTAVEDGVSGLEISVGRAVPPQPKRVDIR